MLEISEIEKFFQEHPLKEEFFRFPADERKSACAVAERDVHAAVDFAGIPADFAGIFLAAVAEQGIFLLLNPQNLVGNADGVASETSAGNSRSYRERKNPLCLRAASLLAPLKNAGNYAVVSLRRG